MPNTANLLPAAAVLALADIAAVVLAAGTRPSVRWYLHLAAALYAALALAIGFSLAPVFVAPIAVTSAAAGLMLATQASFRRPARARVVVPIFLITAACGMGVTFGAAPWLSALIQLLAALVLFIIARRGLLRGRYPSILLTGGAVALVAAACASVTDAPEAVTAVALFSAAGLLGVVLAVARISDTIVRPLRLGARRKVKPVRL